ncbi:unnamed protein product [Adineta steineri]|uniref:Uncharacterized protein n=2 Tax=Adineta steineri TaxID=433720 RepID=A0A815I6J9_9BILA|nr:unnamed protein product [Adineta steineri]
MQYFILAIIVFGCACNHSTVTGGPMVNAREAETSPETSQVYPTALLARNSPDAKPVRVIHSPISSARKHGDESNTPETGLLRKPVEINDEHLKHSSVMPVVIPIRKPNNSSKHKKGMSHNKSSGENTIVNCAHVECPAILCQNSLPSIPSQGICCPRCPTNSKCNKTACPKYKCVTYLVPANITAGECCDHCAPLSATTTTVATKKHAMAHRPSSKTLSEGKGASKTKHDETHERDMEELHREADRPSSKSLSEGKGASKPKHDETHRRDMEEFHREADRPSSKSLSEGKGANKTKHDETHKRDMEEFHREANRPSSKSLSEGKGTNKTKHDETHRHDMDEFHREADRHYVKLVRLLTKMLGRLGYLNPRHHHNHHTESDDQ